MENADRLSRTMPKFKEPMEDTMIAPEEIKYFPWNTIRALVTLDDFKIELQKDDDIKKRIEYLKGGKWNKNDSYNHL